MDNLFWGVDIGGTNVKLGLLTQGGEVLGFENLPTKVEAGPGAMVERIVDTCDRMLAAKDVSRERVTAVGIGSPGPLSIQEGKLYELANLPGFTDFRLRAELSGRLGVPALLENDANAACWGEFWKGAGKTVRDMVMFTLGTGIGGGIVMNGELVHGGEYNGAELGHMIITMGGRQCNCGQKGCLEAYASATHTVARAVEGLEAGRQSSLAEVLTENSGITSKDIFDAAAAGDVFALEVVDGTALALAVASLNMRHITEPVMVVLGGGMVNAGTILTDRICWHFQQQQWQLKPERMEIRIAKLGSDAGFIGAAGYAIHEYEKDGELYPPGK